MIALTIAKLATEAVVSVGVGTVISNAIKATTPETTTKLAKVGIAIGSMAIGGLVSEMAANSVTNKIDGLVETFSKKKADPTPPPADENN